MRLLRFASVKLSLFLSLGICLEFYFELGYTLLWTIPVLVLCLAFFIKRNRAFLFEFSAYFLVLVLGIFITHFANPKNKLDYYGKLTYQKATQWHLKIVEVLKPTAYSHRYRASVVALENQTASGLVELLITRDSVQKPFSVDSEWTLIGNVKAIASPLNPYQFDYNKYSKKQGIQHQIRSSFSAVIPIANSTRTLKGWAAQLRNTISLKLVSYPFGQEELAVIKALLLGERNDIPDATYSNYKDAGAVHILAVSGLHVGVILWLLHLLLSPITRLRNGKLLKLVITVILLWCFALIAGLSPSIVRAVTLFSFVAYALYINRPTNNFNILGLSFFFILVFKPLFLFQLGFQLSYTAVAAILWIHPKLQAFWYPKNLVVRKAWQLLSVSISAQLGVLPISLFYFHQFPALFFISNLIVVPFLGLLLGLGLICIVLALLEVLPNSIARLLNFLIGTMNDLIAWVAQQERFVFRNISFDSIQLILSYGCIIGVVVYLSRFKNRSILVVLACIIGLQLWLFVEHRERNTTEQFEVLHQTANTLIVHQKRDSLLVYAANTKKAERIIENYVVGERLYQTEWKSLPNYFSLKSNSLLLIDSTGVYINTRSNPTVLLTQSPKIHLERLIDSLQPKRILADGSNYRSSIARWRNTCQEKEIPFHYTGEKGYYSFHLE